MKKCSKCQAHKPLEEFFKKSDARDGRHPSCIVCDKKRRKDLRDSRIDEERAKDNARYRTRRDAKRAYDRGYYAANAVNIRSSVRDYQKENKIRLMPFRRQAAMRRYATKKQATPTWADKAKIAEFYFAADLLCMITGEWYDVDHIVPLQSKEVCGLHVEHNLQILPRFENQSKGNRFWPDKP